MAAERGYGGGVEFGGGSAPLSRTLISVSADPDRPPARSSALSEDPGGAGAGSAAPASGERTAADVIDGFTPESDLERAVASDAELIAGLEWGKPRSGHPEGTVAAHVKDLLHAIDAAGETGTRRAQLRFIVLVHDSMKYRVHDWLPRSGPNHHAVRARKFAERYTDDEDVLATIELHDRPYALWRKMRRKGRLDEQGFARMEERISDPDLFLRFVELDGSTEGKRPEPIEWLRDELGRRRSA